jgi:AcrR family transcriptional regulator
MGGLAAWRAALEEAMQRLLGGRPSHTDGALTIANLAREAGVSRATANRATDIVDRFRARLGTAAGEDLPATLRERIRTLTAQIAEIKQREHQEIADLRATVRSPSPNLPGFSGGPLMQVTLDIADAMELEQLLDFLADWMKSDHDYLAPSLAQFLGVQFEPACIAAGRSARPVR